MLVRSRHFDWMLTAVIAAALSFCCCEGRLALDAASFLSGAGAAEAGRGSGHGCCSSDPVEAPDGAPCDDDRPCKCSQHKQAKNLPDGPEFLAGAAPVALMTVPVSIETVVAAPAVPPGGRSVTVMRPVTTLLRLHCALII